MNEEQTKTLIDAAKSMDAGISATQDDVAKARTLLEELEADLARMLGQRDALLDGTA